jgi:hypothetical protein
MQSKGRARSKTGDALFVLLRDEAGFEQWAKNKEEYLNYEAMETVGRGNHLGNSLVYDGKPFRC